MNDQERERYTRQLSIDGFGEQAQEKLANQRTRPATDSVIAHWRSIAAGQVPFGYTVRD